MTDFLFANNATTQVASALTSGGTSLQVSTGSGALFPAPAANQQFAVKLADAATGLITEIVYCTGVTGDTLTIVRAQEGTTARAWNVGDTVLCGPTAGQMQTFAQPSTLQAQAGNFGTDTGSANAMAVTLTPAPYAYTAGLTLRVLKSAATNTGAMTINVNGLGAKSIIYPGGGAIQAGQALASSVMMLVYDGTAFEWVGSAAPAWRTVSSGPWYVNASTGSDSNNGLTSGTAWATIQHAVSQIQHNYDLGGAAATVNLLGAFTAGFTVNQPWVGGTVIFDGGSSSTTSIEPASTSAVIGTGSGVDFTIQNVTLAAPGAAKAALVATVNAVVNLGNGVMFGQCGAAQILASFGGTVSGGGASYSCTSSGGNSPVHASELGGTVIINNASITLVGTPAFATAFLQASGPGTVFCNALTFTGSGSGPGWLAQENGFVNTQSTTSNITGAGFSTGTYASGGQIA